MDTPCPKHPGVHPGNQPEGSGRCPLCLVEAWDQAPDPTPWRYGGQPYATYEAALAAKRAWWAQRGCHLHSCPECFEDWACQDADGAPEETEKLCNHCRQAELR